MSTLTFPYLSGGTMHYATVYNKIHMDLVIELNVKVNFTKWSSVACLVQQCATGDFVALGMLAKALFTRRKKKNIPCEIFSMFAKYYKMSFV